MVSFLNGQICFQFHPKVKPLDAFLPHLFVFVFLNVALSPLLYLKDPKVRIAVLALEHSVIP